MIRTLTLAIALCGTLPLAAPHGHAQESASSNVPEEVVVTGKQPGPKLWRVSNGDNELWILATLTPQPKKMQWDAQSVLAILDDTQEVIEPPHVSVNANPLKLALMLPSLWGIQNNPNKEKLKDILPADLYERWLALKEIYIGTNRKIERKRPILAATELYNDALDQSGLTSISSVQNEVNGFVKKRKITTVSTGIARRLDKPRALLKQFKKATIDDTACFEKTIERVERDLPAMQARAIAWAAGDLQAFRALPYINHNDTCINAILDSALATELAESMALENLQDQLQDKWLSAAENALQNNAVTFATLPIDEILKPNGYLELLKAKGYGVSGAQSTQSLGPATNPNSPGLLLFDSSLRCACSAIGLQQDQTKHLPDWVASSSHSLTYASNRQRMQRR